MAEFYSLQTPRYHRTGTLADLLRGRTVLGHPWIQFALEIIGGRGLDGTAEAAPAEQLAEHRAGDLVTLVGVTRERALLAPDGTIVPAERFTVVQVLKPLHENPARANWLALERERAAGGDLQALICQEDLSGPIIGAP